MLKYRTSFYCIAKLIDRFTKIVWKNLYLMFVSFAKLCFFLPAMFLKVLHILHKTARMPLNKRISLHVKWQRIPSLTFSLEFVLWFSVNHVLSTRPYCLLFGHFFQLLIHGAHQIESRIGTSFRNLADVRLLNSRAAHDKFHLYHIVGTYFSISIP